MTSYIVQPTKGYFDSFCFRSGTCCREKDCPHFCLGCESLFCVGPSMSSSRIFVSDMYDLRPGYNLISHYYPTLISDSVLYLPPSVQSPHPLTPTQVTNLSKILPWSSIGLSCVLVLDPTDNRMIRLTNCLQLLSCVCDVAAIFDENLRHLAHMIHVTAELCFYTIVGCMAAQVRILFFTSHTLMNYSLTITLFLVFVYFIVPSGQPWNWCAESKFLHLLRCSRSLICWRRGGSYDESQREIVGINIVAYLIIMFVVCFNF